MGGLGSDVGVEKSPARGTGVTLHFSRHLAVVTFSSAFSHLFTVADMALSRAGIN
jgi:hypothetical protein